MSLRGSRSRESGPTPLATADDDEYVRDRGESGEVAEEREQDVEETFDRTVLEGRRRLSRPLTALFATGFVGGLDIGTGVLAYLLVRHAGGGELLAGLAFSIAFIALLLAGSELFTEGFFVPVAAVIAKSASTANLLRLWAGTMAFNLLGGLAITWLIVLGFPKLHDTIIETGLKYIEYGHGARALSLAVMAGAAMTLMTWMQQGAEEMSGKLAAAVSIGFLLAGAGLFHSILDSLFIFAALHTGDAPFGYLDWASSFGIAVAGNMIGGVGLVTMLRLLQIPQRVREQRDAPGGSTAPRRA